MLKFLVDDEATKLCCRAPKTVSDLIQAIQSGGLGFCLVVDALGSYLGSVTDGDIRRAIIAGISASDNAELVVNTTAIRAESPISPEDATKILYQSKIRFLPIVDNLQNVVAIGLEETAKRAKSSSAVILAGGRGTRLGKLTDLVPKPLVPYQGKPMIYWLVKKLEKEGFSNLTVSVHYRASQIRDFFDDLTDLDVSLDIVEEEEPMGTAGPLSLLPSDIEEDRLVVNADVVTGLNFRAMMDFHEFNGSDVTVGAVTYRHQVPFGVIREEGGRVISIDEKPTSAWFVSAGVYAFSPRAIGKVPKSFIGVPDVVNKFSQGLKVTTFPIHEDWFDVGTPSDLSKVNSGALDVEHR